MSGEPTSSLSIALVELVGNLAWAALALYAIYTFKRPLSELLKRVASLKVAGNEFVFQPSNPSSAALSQKATPNVELGPDGFLTIESLRTFVSNSGLLDHGEYVESELLFFHTPKQKTWLISTTSFVFVLLDSEATRGKLNVVQTFFERNRVLPLDIEGGDGTGSVRFAAENTWWYYSTYLFANKSDLNDAIRRLVKRREAT